MKVKSLVVAVGLALVIKGHAHEGHGIPGALPPAPHGGVIQEALHQEKDVHAGKEEAELFFEVVYKDKVLKIYPLVLTPTNTATFTSMTASKELSKVAVKVEFPRTKKIEPLKVEFKEEAIHSAFDPKGANRFIVHITAEHAKESKVAKIQIERQ